MIVFNNWTLTVTGLIARQYDNLSRRIDVEGDLPAGYTWQLLVQSGGNADTILLEATETGAGALLTADNLSRAGEYYIQLRGVLEADGVTKRHTNVVSAYIPESLTGLGTWPEVPTEFTQIEQRCAASMIAAESAAEVAKADADRAAALAAEVAEKAAQTAQDATESAQAKEAAQTAKRLADEAQSAAEAARNAAETAQAAAEQSATDAVGAKQGAEAALKAAKAQADAAARSAADAAQSAQKAAESAAVYDDVVTDVNQLKQDIVAITPDDTAVDGKPWTSKHIVDSLCQPIEENGNPVQCYPVENYPLGIKVSWEPVQEGSGDPSPDNIRPITGRDAVQVTRCGRNLLKPPGYNKSSNGIVFTENDDGTVTINGTATGTAYYNYNSTANQKELPEGDYVLIPGSEVTRIVIYDIESDDRYSSSVGGNSTRHIPAGKYGIYIAVDTGATVDNVIARPQIVLGSTATPYEPYTGSTTNIALPETVYGGEVDAESSEGLETWKMLTLDGTERWGDNGSVPGRKEQQWALYKILAPYSGTFGISSHFGNTNSPYKYPFNIIRISGTSIVLHVALDGPFATVDGLKAYLAAQYAAGTPVQVCYKLAEPVPFTATGAQPIPALSGVNTIYTDADSVVVTGAEDPKHTITELKNAIISLGGNV